MRTLPAPALLKRLFLSLALPFFFSALGAQNSTANFIAAGDAHARSFDNRAALQAYLKAHAADSSNCTALWKIAEAYVNIGEDSDPITQRQYYYTAEKWALKAAAQCPDTGNAHFFVAVTSGLLGLHESGKQKLARSKIVKEEAEKTLQLDPNHHGAYHVLGRWQREVANLSWVLKVAAKIMYGGVPPGASNEGSVENFKKAIAISPQWINHHKELGLTYLAMKEWQLAEQEFKLALELPIADHQDEFHKRECRRLLEQIKKRR
jgi:tetratricopeptide (TPR) repeat protein